MVVGSFHAGCARRRAPGRDDLLVRRRDRDDAIPAGGLDDAGHVRVTGARGSSSPRRSPRSAPRSGVRHRRIFAALGIFQMGLGLAFLTVGARPLPGRRSHSSLAARGRPRPALGLARLLRAAEHVEPLAPAGPSLTAAIVVQATAYAISTSSPLCRNGSPAALPESGRKIETAGRSGLVARSA